LETHLDKLCLRRMQGSALASLRIAQLNKKTNIAAGEVQKNFSNALRLKPVKKLLKLSTGASAKTWSNCDSYYAHCTLNSSCTTTSSLVYHWSTRRKVEMGHWVLIIEYRQCTHEKLARMVALLNENPGINWRMKWQPKRFLEIVDLGLQGILFKNSYRLRVQFILIAGLDEKTGCFTIKA